MKSMLYLNIANALEEDLVDYLLSLDFVDGFTTYSVHGHGGNDSMSVAEQVAGRRSRKQYEIILEQECVEKLLQGLANAVGKGIEFWEQPVLRHGSVK